jgi:hypothetical protein
MVVSHIFYCHDLSYLNTRVFIIVDTASNSPPSMPKQPKDLVKIHHHNTSQRSMPPSRKNLPKDSELKVSQHSSSSSKILIIPHIFNSLLIVRESKLNSLVVDQKTILSTGSLRESVPHQLKLPANNLLRRLLQPSSA